MKFERVITNQYKGWFDYVCGNVTIRKTHHMNMSTGKEMSEQMYKILCDGEEVSIAFTLKEAKEAAKRYIK